MLTEHAVDGRRRRAADRDALLHSAAAARPRRVLPRARRGPRRAVDDLSHSGPHGRRRHARHAEGRQGQARRISSASSRPSTISVSSPNACTSSARDFKVFVGPRGAQLPDDDDRRLRPHERRRQPEAEGARADVRGRVRRRSRDGQAPARATARDQQGRVLRHEPDSDEVHDEEARPARRQRAPPADGERDAGARGQARRRARARRVYSAPCAS